MKMKDKLRNAADQAGFPKPKKAADALLNASEALESKLPEGCVAIVGITHPDASEHLATIYMTDREGMSELNESIGNALAVAVGRSDSKDKETRIVGFRL